MFTKEGFAHLLERSYRTSGFQNTGRRFGLAYRSLRLSMLLEPDRRESFRKQRQELLAAWREFATHHGQKRFPR